MYIDFKSKYLKYKNKYLNLKRQLGGSYFIKNPENTRKFNNIDLWDTLNETTVKKIYNNELDQTTINKLLVTGILTADNIIKHFLHQL